MDAIREFGTKLRPGKQHFLPILYNSPTLGTRLASQLARSLCGTEAMVYMAKILATVSQMISILA